MMEDLAMHMMEIIMNSIHANSKNIEIEVIDSEEKNLIKMTIKDDGKGMTKDLLLKIVDPFVTTRTTRKIGMGVAFMKGLAEQCDGSFDAKSNVGKGTVISASVRRDHIDVPPMGNLGEMMMQCIQADENIDYIFNYIADKGSFLFTTKEVKEQIEGMSIVEPEILLWIKDYINQGITQARDKTVINNQDNINTQEL